MTLYTDHSTGRVYERDGRYIKIVVAIAAAALLLVLAACGSPPRIEYVPYEVKVPIEVPCAAAIPPEPWWATEGIVAATPENFDQHVRALLAERKQRIGYEKQLKAAVDGCR